MRRNWRQREVADQIGATVVTIRRWEQGSQQPSAYFRIKLCALFEKSAEELGLFPDPQPSSRGCLVWLLMGGVAVLRHATIRCLLWRSRTFPRQAVSFLDDATIHILLRRVGGGYSFTHRLLLDTLPSLPLERYCQKIEKDRYYQSSNDS